jgi:hypothetical protein
MPRGPRELVRHGDAARHVEQELPLRRPDVHEHLASLLADGDEREYVEPLPQPELSEQPFRAEP